MGDFQGGSGFINCGGVSGTLIKSHDDIGAQLHFGGDGDFGRKKIKGAIQVGTELNTSRRSISFERPDLKTAAVGENGLVPVHKRMKPAHFGNKIASRPQKEMIVVCQNDLGFYFDQIGRVDGLDRSVGADRHKNRGVDVSVGGGEDTGSAAAGQFSGDFVFKHACYYMLFVPKEGNFLGLDILVF